MKKRKFKNFAKKQNLPRVGKACSVPKRGKPIPPTKVKPGR